MAIVGNGDYEEDLAKWDEPLGKKSLHLDYKILVVGDNEYPNEICKKLNDEAYRGWEFVTAIHTSHGTNQLVFKKSLLTKE